MKRKIIQITQKPFVQNVIVMVTGTIGAQIVKMTLSPIITRVYGPEAYGVMGVFISIIQFIIPVAALTYPMAIVLPKNDLNAKGLIKLSLYISSVLTLIIMIFLVIFKNIIVEYFNIGEAATYLFLIPIVIIFTTLMQVSEQWYIRTKQFGINAKVSFYQAVILEFSKVGIGLITPTASVLVGLTAVANGLKALMLILFGRKSKYKSPNTSSEKRLSLKEIAKRHKDFPLLRAPQAFIDAITKGLPVLLLMTFFGPVSSGFYTLCRTVLTLPSSLIGKSVGDVFYPRINGALIKKEKLSSLIKKAVFALSGLGIVPFGLLIAFGPWLFGFVFGDSWVTAGEYARWLALSSFFRFINEPCIRALPVLSAQSLHLCVTIVQTLIRVASLWFGFFVFNDDKIAIALYGISDGLINFLLIILTLNISKKIEKNSK